MITLAAFIALTIAWVLLLWNTRCNALTGVASTVGLICAVLGPFFSATGLAVWMAVASGAAFGVIHFQMDHSLTLPLIYRDYRDRRSLDWGNKWKALSLIGAVGSLILTAHLAGTF